ncbi:hypothetical protein T11_2377, partial [Trichinella zimbabwensis]
KNSNLSRCFPPHSECLTPNTKEVIKFLQSRKSSGQGAQVAGYLPLRHSHRNEPVKNFKIAFSAPHRLYHFKECLMVIVHCLKTEAFEIKPEKCHLLMYKNIWQFLRLALHYWWFAKTCNRTISSVDLVVL